MPSWAWVLTTLPTSNWWRSTWIRFPFQSPFHFYQGTQVRPDIRLSDAHAADYDVIVFVRGYQYDADDPEAQRIAQEAVAKRRLLAAICVAPITLARAGVVEGKRVTASTGAPQLEAAGAIFAGGPVQRDGLIITANGPGASRQFGEAIAEALEE